MLPSLTNHLADDILIIGVKYMYTIDEIKKKVAPVAKKYNIQKVYLFGSYARGEATEKSDVDLLIEFTKLKGLFALGGVYADLEENFENGVDVVSMRAIDPQRDESFYKNVMKDRILVYE